MATDTLRDRFDQIQRRAFILGIAALTLAVLDGIRAPEQFVRSYLLAFVFWLGFPLGCAAFLMVHHLTGGFWGLPIRRPLEAGTRTLPLLTALALPLLLGLSRLYSWTHSDLVAADVALKLKQPYLNLPFFLIRNGIYFAVWWTLTVRLNRWSDEQDRTGDPLLAARLENMSGPGLVLYGLTVTFFSIDWIMSLEPHWFSTIFGMIFMVLQVLGALALAILVAGLLSRREPIASAITPDRFNDLGNLVLTFVMLWAYLAFSQFLIIWAGNLIKEIPWYVTRAEGGWAVVALVMIFFSFAIPFYLLLMRAVKRSTETLSILCGALIITNFVDVYWMVVPAFEKSGPRFYLLDFLLPVGMGGIWVAAFVRQLKSRPLLPLHDPRFAGALEHGH
ncbi:MAG: hypothetical protein DMG32_08715 [Acidobacteria bacterium]|nr:MAG: hypothetical protein DMG32_08715 [Acidobacteriota bacterium]